MKRSVVPAQITTVEDHIFGGLAPHQLVLMLSPLCFGFLMYAVAPPNFRLTLYKVGIAVVLEIVGATLSIRIKDKIVLLWLITILKYNLRPRYYLYNKNDAFLRAATVDEPEKAAKKEKALAATVPKLPTLALPDAVRVREIMTDPRADLRYITRKDGKLNVVIQEIK
jgi:hypothetical protein